METTTILRSEIDRSVNIITPVGETGFFEARYVRRTKDTLIVYISAASGCSQACRFCWLVQTGQTGSCQATIDDFVTQAKQVLNLEVALEDYHEIQNIHFNFMARGEPLANPCILDDPFRLFFKLEKIARTFKKDVTVKFKISTIFPSSWSSYLPYGRTWIRDILDSRYNVEFYYSLYSLKRSFRKRWIPKSMDPEDVGRLFSGLDEGFRIHHPLISGENDTEEDIALIHDWLERHDLKAIYNMVRYNPFDASCGEESDETTRRYYLNQLNLSHRITQMQVIPRVGTDARASCGMFYEDEV